MLVNRITCYPEVPPQPGGPGGYRPDSFDHLIGTEITCPGLDNTWHHHVVDATVAADGASADITLHSSPPPGVSLDRGIRVVTWQPPAHVKAHDPEGNELTALRLDAPLQAGQLVEVGNQAYRVVGEPRWPHRNEHGICRGSIDWQHVTLRPDPQPPHEPTKRE